MTIAAGGDPDVLSTAMNASLDPRRIGLAVVVTTAVVALEISGVASPGTLVTLAGALLFNVVIEGVCRAAQRYLVVARRILSGKRH